MVWILNEEEIRSMLTMRECIEAVEEAYQELALGRAQNIPRGRMRYDRNREGNEYFFNCIPGSVLKLGVAGIRLDSQTRVPAARDSGRAHEGQLTDDKFCGLILLFGMATGEPLAILPDFTISGMRVGATSAMALKHLARKGSKRVGLFGSGKQARSHIEAVAEVLAIEAVKVFSPNREHRVAFAEEMTATVGVEIVPVDQPKKAVEGADIILCTTNATRPIFDGAWLEEGMTLVSIVGGDRLHNLQARVQRSELDETTLLRCQPIILNLKEQVRIDRQGIFFQLMQQGKLKLDDMPEVQEVVTGSRPGRTDDKEIVLFYNNTGIGIQFVAAGVRAYENARRKGVGKEIPTEWFMTDLASWHARGFSPSP